MRLFKNIRFDLYAVLLATLTTVFALPASAQFRVEVSGVGLTQLPIAVTAFRGQDSAPVSYTHLTLPTIYSV